MHRSVLSALGVLLLVSGLATSASAQKEAVKPPPLSFQELRPQPTLPVALVPFKIDQEVCQGGYQPVVTLKLYSVLGRPEVTLYLHTKRREALDSLRLRCGSYVAVWDGTIDGGNRLARPGVYYLRLATDRGLIKTRQVIISGP